MGIWIEMKIGIGMKIGSRTGTGQGGKGVDGYGNGKYGYGRSSRAGSYRRCQEHFESCHEKEANLCGAGIVEIWWRSGGDLVEIWWRSGGDLAEICWRSGWGGRDVVWGWG